MFEWTQDLSTPLVMAVVVGGYVGVTCALIPLVRPLTRRLRQGEADWNGVIGAVLSCFGVFYGLLLGLLAVAAYQNVEVAESRVFGEASALAGIYFDLADYPEPSRTELKVLLREYTRATAEEDWPVQRQGKIPNEGTMRMRAFLAKMHGYEPETKGQEILHASMMGRCDELRELRRQRLYSATLGLPTILWYVVIVGALVNIFLLSLFDMRIRNLLLLGGMLSFFLATVICTIGVMDNPFRGPIGITAEPFHVVLEKVMIQ